MQETTDGSGLGNVPPTYDPWPSGVSILWNPCLGS